MQLKHFGFLKQHCPLCSPNTCICLIALSTWSCINWNTQTTVIKRNKKKCSSGLLERLLFISGSIIKCVLVHTNSKDIEPCYWLLSSQVSSLKHDAKKDFRNMEQKYHVYHLYCYYPGIRSSLIPVIIIIKRYLKLGVAEHTEPKACCRR